jgi:hypothetical protein
MRARRNIFLPKKEELTGGWWKLHNLYVDFAKHDWDDQINVYEMGREYSMDERN